MSNSIIKISPLSFSWQPLDPFLFCAYHDDHYPAGNEEMGPIGSLAGRNLGSDFEIKDGWRMYHGETIPGFPPHPHRGFETITLVRRGLIDHADSLGAGARFGGGDVQWVTAGKGIVHSEMFPLLNKEGKNPLELFQIWLNLPKKNKMADPYFVMYWNHEVPVTNITDENGRNTQVTVVAGNYLPPHLALIKPLPPPPHSWASETNADVAVWTLKMEPHAKWTLPPALAGSNRMLFYFKGKSIQAEGNKIAVQSSLTLRAESELEIENGEEESELLLLQGKPINEPISQYGPFVMNTREEIEQAFTDYQKTRFGGWPWDTEEPVHGRDPKRFAKYPDGKVVKPE